MTPDRDEHIINNLKLVGSRVVKLNNGVFDDDLYQEGVTGLILAVDRFDESRGYKFSTFAVPYIDGYIRMYRNQNCVIKPKRDRDGHYTRKEVISMDSPIPNSANDDDFCLRDVLVSCEYTEEHMISELSLDEFITQLSEEERIVIELAQNECSQMSISEVLNCSQVKISRVLKRIRKKYRRCDQLARA